MLRKLLPILCLLITTHAYATHLNGGELRYTFEDTGYRIYLTLYENCDAVLPLPNSQQIKAVSGNCGTYNITIPVVDSEIIGRNWCPAVNAVCGGVYPMQRAYYYEGFLTLGACPDWVITATVTALSNDISNLMNPGSSALVLEAGLNNTFGNNSSAWIQNDPPFFLSVNSYHTVPVQVTDPENDSLVSIFSAPTLSPYAYVLPYSVNSPIGSYCAIDNDNIYIDADLQGKYFVYTRVNEYRNGNFIGYHTRVWTTTVTTGQDPEIPLPAPGTQFVYFTHPGATDSITLNFVDSTVTDSVYADFQPAAYPNISLSTSSAPGVGSGSATLHWTVPATYDVADSPYLNMKIYVHDNACDLQGYAYYNVELFVSQPNADSVWPGDANGDHTVNMYDPLYISVANGSTGTTRVGANLSWTAQFSLDWANNFLNGMNYKNADCNGDGTIDITDTLAVTANYGMMHAKQPMHASKAAGLPDLGFVSTGITFSPGATVTVPLKLGDAAMPMNNIYGVATNIKIQGASLASPPSFAYNGSWLGTGPNNLRFTKTIANANNDWVYARTDHQNVSGQGTIGTMTFMVPANANIGDMIVLHPSNTKIIDKNGADVNGYNVVDDTVYVQYPVTTSNLLNAGTTATIAPNPSRGDAAVYLLSETNEAFAIKILDMTGRLVKEQGFTAVKGNNRIAMPMVAKGIYNVQVQSLNGNYLQNLKWLNQ